MSRKSKRPRRRKRARTVTSAPTSSRYAWGVAAIAAEIGRTVNATDHLVRKGFIKSVRKVGHHWVADIEQLHAELRGESAS